MIYFFKVVISMLDGPLFKSICLCKFWSKIKISKEGQRRRKEVMQSKGSPN